MERNLPVNADLSYIGLNVKRFRKEKQWTQEDCAKRAKLSRIALIHIESGKATPTLESILNLCTVLEVPLFTMMSNYSDSQTSDNEGSAEADIALLSQRLKSCSPEQVQAIRKVVDNILQSFSMGTSSPKTLGNMTGFDAGLTLTQMAKSKSEFEENFSLQNQVKA
jgi:transcriptional regulator with XRE-family HTH domain